MTVKPESERKVITNVVAMNFISAQTQCSSDKAAPDCTHVHCADVSVSVSQSQ